jgi:type I restriction enzyme M protein
MKNTIQSIEPNIADINNSQKAFRLEEHINDWVKAQFDKLNLKNQQDFYTESAIPDYLKEALKGRAKTLNKTNFGKPDFSVTKYDAPIIIENKLGLQKLINETKEGIKLDDKSISNFAVNGAIHYATGMIASGKYHEVIVLGIAGDSLDTIAIKVYYVYGSGENSYKLLENVNTLDFLENEDTFNEFYKNAKLTEDEKHEILISSQAELQKYAKSLNKLMHNLNITAPQRVLYISGMLLSMQNVVDTDDNKIQDGLIPEDLKGIQSDTKRDGVQIVNQIQEFLKSRDIPFDKQSLMLASFSEISKDSQRDELTDLDKEVSKLIDGNASSNKQIFTFIYHNIFLSIDAMVGHLDIMGEMYSEFLKYALGDGKEIGIVLTPPYITKMMVTILNIDQNSRVMDLATGSAGFLISAMELMIQDAETSFGKKTSAAESKIKEIKTNQLLGIELNAEMFTLAATNMILRGDGSSNIQKGNTFNTPETLYTNFKANRLLLNPPFSYIENGMPFIAYGLEKMDRGGLGAIIIQDSAGSGKATSTNKSILKKHTLIASVKMPVDLFQPMAGVQTSVYILEAHKPHDYARTVKFIDFRNDGYKRTSRSLQEIDQPAKKYADIVRIFKAGKSAKIESNLNLNEIYTEDFISSSGSDWNFDQHKVIDTKPTLQDFKKTVSDYLAWEVSNILKQNNDSDRLGK